VNVCTGISLTEGEAVVYPNPAHNSFSVRLGSAVSSEAECQVIDLQGRIVSRTTVPAGTNEIQNIDINSFSKGIYFVRIVGNSGVTNQFKLVKE
jgi:outer membrane usher protein FimD/PapC